MQLEQILSTVYKYYWSIQNCIYFCLQIIKLHVLNKQTTWKSSLSFINSGFEF